MSYVVKVTGGALDADVPFVTRPGAIDFADRMKAGGCKAPIFEVSQDRTGTTERVIFA